MAKSKRNQSIVQLLLVIGIAIFLNILGNAFFATLDLTEENRFTLTKPTKQLLNDLDEVVFVQVLLEGELPAGIKRLQKATKEILDDFRSQSGYIEYEFINPSEGTVDDINKVREELAKDGITPTNLRVKGTDETREILFYTYAIVNYKGRSIPINLVDKEGGVLDELTINNSVGLLEYKVANAIQKLQTSTKPYIAFLKGHGELDELQTLDIRRTLRNSYNVGFLDLDSAYHISQDLKMIIVAKPQTEFNEKEKFLIDQYVMNGGKMIWLIDKMAVNLDSLYAVKDYIPHDYPLNLDDQLFKYGTRIQPNLVLDLRCSKIDLVIDAQGNRDKFDWYYHPIVVPESDHPVVKNLDGINLYFPSRIDTIRTKTNIKKTVLLSSSKYSREQFSPVRLNFEILRYDPDPNKFNKGNQPMAVMLEGTFPSLYENRVTEGMTAMLNQINQPFKGESESNKMMVVSDGDIIKNLINPQNNSPSPTGFNRWMGYTFANKDFMVNAIEYMLDDRGVIEARAKDVKLRLLDGVKAKSERSKWQIVNILLPLIFLALFGVVYNFIRRRRYTS